MGSRLTQLDAFMDHYWWLWPAWMLGWIGLSIVLRVMSSRPIFPSLPRDALFKASWASGRSYKNFLTQFGGANNCLLVGVTRDELIVTPFFPFNLMFLPEVYDLEHRIPTSAILGVEPLKRWFRDVIVVRFRRDDGREGALELRLTNPAAFTAALAMGLPPAR
jgi:hypothetical protein